VNLIDTADIYSSGADEEILGHVLRGLRDRVLVATKARFAMGEGPNDAGLSRHHLIEACEASLRRLQIDHIDLYQLHEWVGRVRDRALSPGPAPPTVSARPTCR
jgi:aryl-alcohol dehydrogenase-like predicted oxidoreductase